MVVAVALTGALAQRGGAGYLLLRRRGVPWKGYDSSNGLPTQLLSPPGIFLGYDFDSLDTRNGVDVTVPFSVLARYAHVIWYIDRTTAEMFGPPYDVFAPIGSLRYMTSPNRYNSLGLYLVKGGQLMMFGGGIVTSTVRGWGEIDPQFTTTGAGATLVAGTFPFDALHMRAEMRLAQFSSAVVSARRGALFQPLPTLRHRSITDPLPPLRTVVPISPYVETVIKPL